MDDFPLIDAAEAFARSKANPRSRWPGSTDPDNRLRPLCTPGFHPSFKLEAGESIFTIGSCFARNIEAELVQRGYRCPAREFILPAIEAPTPGTALNKYTPYGMLNEVDFALETEREVARGLPYCRSARQSD